MSLNKHTQIRVNVTLYLDNVDNMWLTWKFVFETATRTHEE